MKKSLARITTGVLVLAVGLILLAVNLGVLDTSFKDVWLTWWPLLIVLAGILIFINDVRNYLWAIFVALSGVAFQVGNLVELPEGVNAWGLIWPLGLVFIGLSIAIRTTGAKRRKISNDKKDELSAIFSGTSKKNVSDDYQGSVVTAVFGGVELDLSGATIKNKAEIDVTVAFGGLELTIPRGVTVYNQTSAILGGVEDKANTESKKGQPELYITGEVILGGIEIKH